MLPDKFQPGDLVRVVKADAPGLLGKKAQIKTPRQYQDVRQPNGVYKNMFVYTIDIFGAGDGWAAEEHCLARWDDGWEKSTWDKGEWRPSTVKMHAAAQSLFGRNYLKKIKEAIFK